MDITVIITYLRRQSDFNNSQVKRNQLETGLKIMGGLKVTQFCHHKSTAQTLWTPNRTSRAASSPEAAEVHPHLIPKEERTGFLIQRLPFQE